MGWDAAWGSKLWGQKNVNYLQVVNLALHQYFYQSISLLQRLFYLQAYSVRIRTQNGTSPSARAAYCVSIGTRKCRKLKFPLPFLYHWEHARQTLVLSRMNNVRLVHMNDLPLVIMRLWWLLKITGWLLGRELYYGISICCTYKRCVDEKANANCLGAQIEYGRTSPAPWHRD